MLTKLGGLARTIYIVLAIIAAFVPMGGLNVALVLVALGLLAGLAMADDRVVLAAVTALVLPVVGAALSLVPAIGEQLNAITANLQLGVAGALATAIAIRLYRLAMEGVTGMTAK